MRFQQHQQHSDRSVTVLIYVAHVRSQLTRGRTASTVTRGRPRARARAARDPPSHGACAAMQHKSPKSVDCSGVAIIA